MVPIVTVSGGGDGADKKDLCHNKGYPMPGPHLHLVRGPKKPACEAETPEAVKTKMEPTERYNSNRTISFAARVRII